jgi:signal transduction histidine kinase
MLAVGVPLAGLGQAYFEVFPVSELDQTLEVLSIVLFLGVLLMTPAAALLGWWVTAPAMRPLTAIAEGASRLAQGDLTARMDPRGHPELIPIAASFNAAAADLERRVKADARFAADVSHELRNPLMTMMGSVSLLEQERDRLPGEAAEAVKLLADEVDRFSRMVQDLLEISRMDAAGMKAELRSVLLPELVRWALPESLRGTLVVEPGATGVTVLADKRRLEQALTNLVANADQHGGGVAAVLVRRDLQSAEVVVDDAGPGVPVEQRSRIFERFARGAAGGRGSGDGAGLGLSLVDRHMQTMNGEVAVGDNARGGARFVIRMPQETR